MDLQQYAREPGGGYVVDTCRVVSHGMECTHVDALCHVWDEHGLWNGKNPASSIKAAGSEWGAVSQWRGGIITRGVLLDVPLHRKLPYVTTDSPVHNLELRAIASGLGLEVRPGDAVVVYSGRDRWEADYGAKWGAGASRPGLHASCLGFLRDTDCSVLLWDMGDAVPNEYGLPWTVHGAIFAYGIAIIDNARLAPLAAACAEEERYEFMVAIAPLPIAGATGSLVNPIAVF